jgi:hypothetical protein
MTFLRARLADVASLISGSFSFHGECSNRRDTLYYLDFGFLSGGNGTIFLSPAHIGFEQQSGVIGFLDGSPYFIKIIPLRVFS